MISYQSLLLSTTVLNDVLNTQLNIYVDHMHQNCHKDENHNSTGYIEYPGNTRSNNVTDMYTATTEQQGRNHEIQKTHTGIHTRLNCYSFLHKHLHQIIFISSFLTKYFSHTRLSGSLFGWEHLPICIPAMLLLFFHN